MPGDLVIVCLSQDGVRSELDAVVSHDHLGLVWLAEEQVEFMGTSDAGDRRIDHQRQTLARAVINHDQDAQPTAVDELVSDEVDRPTMFGTCGTSIAARVPKARLRPPRRRI